MQNFSVHTVSEKNMDHVLNRPYFGIFSRNVHLKNATTLFTKQISIGPQSEFPNEILCILAAERAAELSKYRCKVLGKQFFQPSNFDLWQFCSPLRENTAQYPVRKSKSRTNSILLNKDCDDSTLNVYPRSKGPYLDRA